MIHAYKFPNLSREILHHMTDKAFDYTDGHFVLIMATTSPNQTEIATEIFKEMYARYILNTHFLIQDFYNKNRTIIYTYWPFRPNRCGQVVAEPFNYFENGKFYYKDKYLWPSKIENFYGCSIVVGTFSTGHFVHLKQIDDGRNNKKYEISGFEGKVLNFLAQDMNFSIDVKISEWGSVCKNKQNFTGVLKLVCCICI